METEDGNRPVVMESYRAEDPAAMPARKATVNPHSLSIQLPPNDLQTTIESDRGESDHDDHSLRDDEVQTVLGVSIGREQTRIQSPATPAAEKAAALDNMCTWGFFDGVDEDVEQEEMGQNSSQDLRSYDSLGDIGGRQKAWGGPSTSSLSPSSEQLPRTSEMLDHRKTVADLSPNRSRASSGPTGKLSDLNIMRFLSSFGSLTNSETKNWRDFSLPKLPSILGTSRDIDDREESSGRPGRSNSLFTPRFPWTNSNQSSKGRKSGDEFSKPPSRLGQSDQDYRMEPFKPRPTQLQTHNSDPRSIRSDDTVLADNARPKSLRRVVSDQSLQSHYPLSHVSSLGDDSRWVNVQEQVNSRMKALKDSLQDSLQDSSLKLPSMPSINFSVFRPDFTHKRVASDINGMKSSSGTGNDWDGQTLGHGSNGSVPTSTKPARKSTKSVQSHMDEALEHLIGDVVVMGGYRGSILRSATPPYRRLWVPVKVGLNIRKVNLEVGLEPEDEENMENHIFASGMLTHIGPVDISRRLLKRLRNCKNAREGKLRVHDYGYDWRLSPHLLSARFVQFLESLPGNQPGLSPLERGATVIAHSLGGLITRHAVNQRPELFAGVVYAGVPQHCVNILGPLRNGDEVLLSSRVLTAQVNFTLRTSYLLLPEGGQCFYDKDTKEPYPIDFFSVDTWQEYALSPCIAPVLPSLCAPEKKSLLESVSNSLPSLPFKSSTPTTLTDTLATATTHLTDPSSPTPPHHPNPQTSTSTIPLPHALSYLHRTLTTTHLFKSQLTHLPPLQSSNLYPPFSILYSTSVPTVYGAKVAGRDGIKRADAYDNLVFASGDGVVLARAAMLPDGYHVVRGGRVRTGRGHVGLLGDLEAVGRCLGAVGRARRAGVGVGCAVGMIGGEV